MMINEFSFRKCGIAWLQGHMMWLQRQDAFKEKFGDLAQDNVQKTEWVLFLGFYGMNNFFLLNDGTGWIINGLYFYLTVDSCENTET